MSNGSQRTGDSSKDGKGSLTSRRDDDRNSNRETDRNRDKDRTRDDNDRRDRDRDRDRDGGYGRRQSYDGNRSGGRDYDRGYGRDRDWDRRDGGRGRGGGRNYDRGGRDYGRDRDRRDRDVSPDSMYKLSEIFEKVKSLSGPIEKPIEPNVRDELNAAKCKMDPLDSQMLEKHIRFTRTTSTVVPRLRDRVNPEMATVAFAKMYEILAKYGNEMFQALLSTISSHVKYPAQISGSASGTSASSTSAKSSTSPFSTVPDPLSSDQIIVYLPHFFSVHLCEAPGAFICATNHFLKQKFLGKMNWDWFAVTLNPYYEGNYLDDMIDDDRFITNTSDKWFFGDDNSGNIMKISNIKASWEKAKKMVKSTAAFSLNSRKPSDSDSDSSLVFGPIQLVTADGAIDCGSDPNKQESMTAHLHYAEVVAALGLLTKNGTFVLKMFTFFEHSTLSMVYLLYTLFQRVDVYKPATSKEANSEVYIVCLGYKGVHKDLLEKLLEYVELPTGKSDDDDSVFSSRDPFLTNSLLPLSIMSPAFLKPCFSIVHFFSEEQIQIINNIIETMGTNSVQWKNKLFSAKNFVAEEWMDKTKIKEIPRKDRIVGEKLLTYARGSVTDSTSQKGNKSQFGVNNKDLADQQKKRKLEMEEMAASKKRKLDDGTAVKSENDENKEDTKKSDDEKNPEKNDEEKDENKGEDENSSVGWKLMQKMGFKSGQGLGRENQGMKEPVSVNLKKDLEGLGFGEISSDWFVNVVRVISSGNSFGISSEEVRQQWRWQEGKMIKHVFLSKFCNEKILRQLYSEQKKAVNFLGNFEEMSKYGSLLWPSFFSDNLGFSTNGGLLLAAIDIEADFSEDFAHKKELKIIDLSANSLASGALEYLVTKFNDSAENFVVITPDDNAKISNSKYSVAQNPKVKSIKLPVSHAPTSSSSSNSSSSSTTSSSSASPTPSTSYILPFNEEKHRSLCASTLSEANGKVDVFVGTLGDGRDCTQGNVGYLLSEILFGISTLSPGGLLICRSERNVRRATVGLIYAIASAFFESVFFLKPFTSCPAFGEQFFVCKNFLGEKTAGGETAQVYLYKVLNRVNELMGTEYDILETTPTQIYIKSKFFTEFCRVNEESIRREIIALETLQKNVEDFKNFTEAQVKERRDAVKQKCEQILGMVLKH